MAAARWTTTRRNLGSRCFCFKKNIQMHTSQGQVFCAHFVTEGMAESVWRACGGVEVLYP